MCMCCTADIIIVACIIIVFLHVVDVFMAITEPVFISARIPSIHMCTGTRCYVIKVVAVILQLQQCGSVN